MRRRRCCRYDRSFTDLKLVIDSRTYTNVEGRWRDLFNKMKAREGGALPRGREEKRSEGGREGGRSRGGGSVGRACGLQ